MIPENISATLIQASAAFDTAMRRLNPLALADLRKELLFYLEPLQASRKLMHTASPGQMNARIKTGLLRACDFLMTAIRTFANEEDMEASYIAALRAARKHCRALEALFALCDAFPEIHRYFLAPDSHPDALGRIKAENAPAGLFHLGSNQDLHARGGYSLFIPEICKTAKASPLIVALHGGYSHGRDFIWTWLSHARSRGYVLFAPTSQAMSWSMMNSDIDGPGLAGQLEDLFSRIGIDRSRILLTGMSDGGTYALKLSLSGGSLFGSVAPVACVLPPVNLKHAQRKRIFWIHGARDWIFPASNTVGAAKNLRNAGADIRLKIIDDLSHAYPREENSAILNWFESAFTDF